MSDHPDLRPLLGEGWSDATARRSILDHVRRCAVCRAALSRDDPSRLFALLALEAVPDHVLERVSRRSAEEIVRERRRAAGRRRVAWGALAASLLMAGWLGSYLWPPPGSEGPPLTPPAIVDAPRATAAEGAMPAGMIELLESPSSADVVEMTVGDVEVVMIFDEALQI